MTDFLCDQGADTGKSHIKGFGKRKWFAQNGFPETFLCDGERIFFVLCMWNKIFPAGKNFPDGTHLGAYMLDAVDDPVSVITENDVAVFAHDLYSQYLVTKVAELI